MSEEQSSEKQKKKVSKLVIAGFIFGCASWFWFGLLIVWPPHKPLAINGYNMAFPGLHIFSIIGFICSVLGLIINYKKNRDYFRGMGLAFLGLVISLFMLTYIGIIWLSVLCLGNR